MFVVLAIACLIPLYFAPAIAAFTGKHRNAQSILMLNLLLGWTGIGYIAAMIWAASDNNGRSMRRS